LGSRRPDAESAADDRSRGEHYNRGAAIAIGANLRGRRA
jgi:hypothetical protein